jgi:hypothetical protein
MESVIYWLMNHHGYKVNVIQERVGFIHFTIKLPNGGTAVVGCEEITSGQLTTVVVTMGFTSPSCHWNGPKENAFRMNDNDFIASGAENCYFWIVQEADAFDK